MYIKKFRNLTLPDLKKQVKRSLNSTVAPFLPDETDAELRGNKNSLFLIRTICVYYEFTSMYETN